MVHPLKTVQNSRQTDAPTDGQDTQTYRCALAKMRLSLPVFRADLMADSIRLGGKRCVWSIREARRRSRLLRVSSLSQRCRTVSRRSCNKHPHPLVCRSMYVHVHVSKEGSNRVSKRY